MSIIREPRDKIITLEDDSCRNKVACNVILIVTGLSLLIVRMLAMTFASGNHVYFTSTFFIITMSISLISQLRSPFLNSIVMTAFPVMIFMSLLDIYHLILNSMDTWTFLWFITMHIPVAILGIIIFTIRREMTNVVSVILSISVSCAWMILVDPRISVNFLSFMTFDSSDLIIMLWFGMYLIPSGYMMYDLHHHRSIHGSVSISICKC